MIEIPGVGMVKISAIQVVGFVYDDCGIHKYKVVIGGHGFEVEEDEMSREELIKSITACKRTPYLRNH